jgi:hypothetical protein
MTDDRGTYRPLACIDCAAPLRPGPDDAGHCLACVRKWLRKIKRTPTRRNCAECGTLFRPPTKAKAAILCGACADWNAFRYHSDRIAEAAAALAQAGGREAPPWPLASAIAHHVAERMAPARRIQKRERKARRAARSAR